MNSMKGMHGGRGVHRLIGENPAVGGKWGWVQRVYWKFREAERILRISRLGQWSTLTMQLKRLEDLKSADQIIIG